MVQLPVTESHRGQLGLFIPLRVDANKYWNGLLAITREENGEFLVTVDLVTRTAGIQVQSVKALGNELNI